MPEPNSRMLEGSGVGPQSGLPPAMVQQKQVPVTVNASEAIEPMVFS